MCFWVFLSIPFYLLHTHPIYIPTYFNTHIFWPASFRPCSSNYDPTSAWAGSGRPGAAFAGINHRRFPPPSINLISCRIVCQPYVWSVHCRCIGGLASFLTGSPLPRFPRVQGKRKWEGNEGIHDVYNLGMSNNEGL